MVSLIFFISFFPFFFVPVDLSIRCIFLIKKQFNWTSSLTNLSGIERARPPTPPPAPRTPRPTRDRDQCETDIDIRRSRGETDIDVRHTHTRSSSRPAPRPRPQSRPSYDDEHVVIRSNDRDRIAVAETTRRRAHSEARRREDWDDEAKYITGKIDARGRMGEAWNGATRDWSIVDVPPGTERVSMDGVGGGSAEVTWQRYNGVRRSKFVPERDGGAPLTSPPMSSTPVSEAPDRDRERLSVQIYDSSNKDRDRGRSRDSDVEIEEIRDKRISIRESSRAPPPKRTSREMWTEITKDLVVREAIEQSGYDYEETEYFFYVMEYLRYVSFLFISFQAFLFFSLIFTCRFDFVILSRWPSIQYPIFHYYSSSFRKKKPKTEC